jgi:O-methyltransferase
VRLPAASAAGTGPPPGARVRLLETSLLSLSRVAWHLDRLPRLGELRDLHTYRRARRLHQELFEGGWTMLGPRRGRMLHRLAGEVDRVGVPGALVDCGVWNGGSTILMASGAPEREVWAFDSFAGLPEPRQLDGRESEGLGGELVGSEQKLREGFERFADRARLHVRAGWFDDTLSSSAQEIGSVAILHCDGDWFESVLVTLEVMYPLVSPGGFVVIDDYGTFPGARRATEEYRLRVGETAPLRRIDRTGRYWRKGTGPGAAL